MSVVQRVAAVTGGSGGIGRAIAARLQRDGLRVALWDLDVHAAREAADALAASLAKIPMQRAGTADEVASLAAWLASDQCSFSTGATFDLSGGRATY